MTTAPAIGQQALAICKAPCGQPTVHEVIRPVSRGRIYLACVTCSSVTSVSKIEMEKQHG